MKTHCKRFISALLALVLSVGMFTFSAPSASAIDKEDLSQSILVFMDAFGLDLPTGPVFMDTLERVRDQYNKALQLAKVSSPLLYGQLGECEIVSISSEKISRLKDIKNDFFIVNAMGAYPYIRTDGDVPNEPGASIPAPPSISRNRFVDVRSLKSPYNVISYTALSEAAVKINDDGYPCTIRKLNDTHYGIVLNSTLNGYFAFYANKGGQPFVAAGDKTATDIDFDYIVNNNNNSIIVDNSQLINVEDNIFTIIDDNGEKVTLNIDSLFYDASNKSYTLNTYQTNIVNEGDNYYYTYNYYTYSVTYNITNTYVTYIGANEAYDKKEYEYYYELPDGRSSADLTAEDIAGISFQFHDMVNYAKSATDVSVRSLYHFDGDTTDSSYFSTQGKFDWKTGASITYMDSGVFNGALYLDNNAHAFDITLPSTIGSGDFSLQFRYYQASQPDTLSNIENSIKIGATTLLSWDEQKFYNGTTSIASMPIGSWSEIALVRKAGTLYTYLNGLCISSRGFSTVLPEKIQFNFGSTSRANSMLDEFRVVNFAVAEGGKSYIPTAVPYDSNLVLVLPDSAKPLADEYLSLSTSGTNLLGYDFTSLTSGKLPTTNFFNWNKSKTSFSPSVGYTRLTRTASGDWSMNNAYRWDAGLHKVFETDNAGLIPKRDYTLSVVLADGTISSFTFKFSNYDTSSLGFYGNEFNRKSFPWGSIHYSRLGWGYGQTRWVLGIDPINSVGSFADIVFMELVEGTKTDLSAEWISCVYPEVDVKPNTAAIQTDIPINGYTVGGVRPTFPAKGDIWMPISGRRISGAYIYTGSMWKEVGCRYYTGTRWIPIYAFDIVTLEDCFDVADAADVTPPITTESGFWNWFKKEWLDFRKWLENVLGSGGGGSGGDGSGSDDTRSFWDKIADAVTNGLATLIEGLFGLVTTVLKSLIGLVTDLLSFVFDFFTDTVLGGIGKFFSSFSDGSLFEFLEPNEDGTGHLLPNGIATVFAFFSGVIMLLPLELRSVLFFGVAALFLFSVLKFIK